MTFGHSSTLRLIPRLEQRLVLSHLIDYANLMTIPDEVLNTIKGAVSFNPDKIESVLRDQKRDAQVTGTAGKVRAAYSSVGANEVEANRKGIIITPDIRSLEGQLGDHPTEIIPDATYIGRKNDKPEIVFSDHLKGAPRLTMNLVDPALHPETAKLLSKLHKFDEWKRGMLKNAYVILGDTQREFFENFDFSKYNKFNQDNLAEKLGLSTPTVSRILANRLVELRNLSGVQRVIYAKDLLATDDDVRRFAILPELNKLLDEEFKNKKAYSDEELLVRSGKSLARRTIAKYRQMSGLPSNGDRTRMYQSNEITEPLRFI